jgi:hypothetical protein
MYSLQRTASRGSLFVFLVTAGAMVGADCPDAGPNQSACPCGVVSVCAGNGACVDPSMDQGSLQNGPFSCKYEKGSACVDQTAEDAQFGGKCYLKVSCATTAQGCVRGQQQAWQYWSPLKKGQSCAPAI